MAFNKKLGRGLSSLMADNEVIQNETLVNKGLIFLPIEYIHNDASQPRKTFDKKKIDELSQSIKKNGLIQPIIVNKKSSDNFILVAGERRWRAAQLAQLKVLPALLLPEDLDKDEVSLIENIQREDLKVLEEAKAYQRLIEKNNYTHETLSKIVGKSRSHISNLIRILSLDEFFLNLLIEGKLSMGHARVLVGKHPNDYDEKMLDHIIKGKVSVRDLERGKMFMKTEDSNLIYEEKNLSNTLGFKIKISYSKKGKGNIKIFYENLEQYNFLINKLKN